MAGKGLGAENSKLSELTEILHGQWVGYICFKNVYLGLGEPVGEVHAFEVADKTYLQN